VLSIRRDLYLKEPITLNGLETSTLEVRVPWFPGSVWLLDVPESTFGPFPGANGWFPGDPLTEVKWVVAPDGQRASYVRAQDGRQLAFVAWVEDGHTVRFRFDVKPPGGFPLQSVCMKTISPFFSSQEQMTQGIILDGVFNRVADLPTSGRWGGSSSSSGRRKPWRGCSTTRPPRGLQPQASKPAFRGWNRHGMGAANRRRHEARRPIMVAGAVLALCLRATRATCERRAATRRNR
jgi:hypothetical protein